MENILLGVKRFLVFTSFVMAFSLVCSPVATYAQEKNEENLTYDKRVKKFEEVFKFIDEEAAIKDANGNVIDIDIDKVREKFGNDKGLDLLEEEIKKDQEHVGVQSWWGCMKSSLMDFFGVNAFQAMLNGGIANYIKKKAWKEAAKIAAKYFAGSSVAGLAATLAYYSGKCAI
ncbi:hypothetical protein [Kroppenstedtia sanguinis]|uniref:hypothetical protein n=1 Tax=Kroppenstedtia sanguinis TaxID=1380684 RepID=UPI0036D359E3